MMKELVIIAARSLSRGEVRRRQYVSRVLEQEIGVS